MRKHFEQEGQFSDFVNGIQISRFDSKVHVQNRFYQASYMAKLHETEQDAK